MQVMQVGDSALSCPSPEPHYPANHRAIRRASGFGPLLVVRISRAARTKRIHLIQTPYVRELLRRTFWNGVELKKSGLLTTVMANEHLIRLGAFPLLSGLGEDTALFFFPSLEPR